MSYRYYLVEGYIPIGKGIREEVDLGIVKIDSLRNIETVRLPLSEIRGKISKIKYTSLSKETFINLERSLALSRERIRNRTSRLEDKPFETAYFLISLESSQLILKNGC